MAGLLGPVVLTLSVACRSEPNPTAPKLQAMSFANSEWSAPVNLGPTINTEFNEQGPTLSNDELSLYFGSDRSGGIGGFDIWVAKRACTGCPWEAPTNLGPVVNSAFDETGALHRRASALLQKHSAGGAGPRGHLPVEPSRSEG